MLKCVFVVVALVCFSYLVSIFVLRLECMFVLGVYFDPVSGKRLNQQAARKQGVLVVHLHKTNRGRRRVIFECVLYAPASLAVLIA